MKINEINNLIQNFNSLQNQLIPITTLIDDCKNLNNVSQYIKSNPFYPDTLVEISNQFYKIRVSIDSKYKLGFSDMPSYLEEVRVKSAEFHSNLNLLKKSIESEENDDVLSRNSEIIRLYQII